MSANVCEPSLAGKTKCLQIFAKILQISALIFEQTLGIMKKYRFVYSAAEAVKSCIATLAFRTLEVTYIYALLVSRLSRSKEISC